MQCVGILPCHVIVIITERRIDVNLVNILLLLLRLPWLFQAFVILSLHPLTSILAKSKHTYWS